MGFHQLKFLKKEIVKMEQLVTHREKVAALEKK
jgi:hypothetical protein